MEAIRSELVMAYLEACRRWLAFAPTECEKDEYINSLLDMKAAWTKMTPEETQGLKPPPQIPAESLDLLQRSNKQVADLLGPLA